MKSREGRRVLQPYVWRLAQLNLNALSSATFRKSIYEYLSSSILLQKLILRILHKIPFFSLSNYQKKVIDIDKTTAIVKKRQTYKYLK